jgi:hypothetical protein
MLTLLSITASAGDQENWFLMSRHGECVAIASIERKVPDIGDIDTPQEFVAHMERKGIEVISNDLYAKERKGLQGIAFDIKIPSEGLSLMFVKRFMCKEFIDRK